MSETTQRMQLEREAVLASLRALSDPTNAAQCNPQIVAYLMKRAADLLDAQEGEGREALSVFEQGQEAGYAAGHEIARDEAAEIAEAFDADEAVVKAIRALRPEMDVCPDCIGEGDTWFDLGCTRCEGTGMVDR